MLIIALNQSLNEPLTQRTSGNALTPVLANKKCKEFSALLVGGRVRSVASRKRSTFRLVP